MQAMGGHGGRSKQSGRSGRALWGQGWACTGALEVEKMGPWSYCCLWGQEPWVHGGHRGRRDGAMRGGRSGWEGCTGTLYGARSHGSL